MDVKSGAIAIQPAGHRCLMNSGSQTIQTIEKCLPAAGTFGQDATDFNMLSVSAVPLAKIPPITSGTKVLILGDSQTVGSYGRSLDSLARATGATVSTHASWGASPYWFFNGNETSKYWSRDKEGLEATLQQVKTPLLNDLLSSERPDVVVVTMGGNMIAGNANQAEVTKQVSQIGNAVSASGAHLIWVGPPKYDPQKRSPELVDQFYQKLYNIMPEYGVLIDSRTHIEDYAGSDGLHYSGAKGERIARQWAHGVFQEIQQTVCQVSTPN